MKPAWIVSCFAWSALCLGWTAPLQDREDPGAVLSTLEEMEESVFTLKNEGRYDEALARLADTTAEAMRRRSGAPEALRAELEARGEVYLELLWSVIEAVPRYDAAEKILDLVPEDAANLKALARRVGLEIALHRGRWEKAAELRDRLGYLQEGYVVGPFDNERGGGFDTVYGPEKALDLSASYEGKERTVSWRKIPVRSLTGYVNLEALFTPFDQCLAYALFFLQAEKATDAALRLGSDEAFKVFLDGHPVAALDARRLHHFDQDVIGLHLEPGIHALLLKVCDQTGPWGFSARLTAPSGAPLEGVRVVEAPEGIRMEGDPSPLSAVEVNGGARAWFTARAAAGEVRAHLYLGILHNAREFEGEDAGQATKHLDAFLEVYPDHALALYEKALSERRRWEIAAERDENRWRLGLERVLELHPEDVVARVRLARYYLSGLPEPNRAIDLARTALKHNPAYLPALYVLSEAYEAKGLVPLARKVILDAAHEPKNLAYPGMRLRLGDLAEKEGRIADAEEHWKAALETDHVLWAAWHRLTDLDLRRGDTAAARARLEEEARVDPFDTEPVVRIARLALAEEKGEETARPLLEKALAVDPEDDGVLARLGDACHQAGRDAEALDWYRKALEINPKAKELRRYVEFLHAKERPFQDDFAVDVQALIAAHPPGENPENASHEYLLLQDVYKVNKDGTSSHYHHRLVRVLNFEGAKRFDTFVTFYTPGEQRCRILTARVLHPDGTVEEAEIDNRERPASPEYGGRAPAYVDLPPLKAGDTLDVAYRTDDLQPSFFGDYFGLRHFFQPPDREAVMDARLSLILPLSRTFRFHGVHFDLEPDVERDETAGTETRTWTLADLPRIVPERYMPGRTETAPYVDVTTYRDWDEMGRWWWNLVKEQGDLSDEMQAYLEELTQGCSTERDKIRAIYDFVVSEIRYNDTWEFGVHGFKPYRCSAVFSNRFGDCKDKAILLKVLLGAAGIEAYPVLIRLEERRSREDLTLPLVSHFNHAIVYVPRADGEEGLFLDGTAQYHPMDVIPGGDQGATVYVVKDGPGEIMTIPYVVDGNVRDERYTVTLSPDGSAEIEGTGEPRGDFDAAVRFAFANPGKRKSRIEKRYGAVLGEVTVEKAAFSDLENLAEPLRYSFTLHAADAWLESGDRVQLRPVLFESNLFTLASEEQRDFDLLLGAPYTVKSTVTYRLPEGFRVAAPPPDTVLENSFAEFSLTFEQGEKGTITARRILRIKVPRITREDYSAFRDFCRTAEQAEKRLIQVETGS